MSIHRRRPGRSALAQTPDEQKSQAADRHICLLTRHRRGKRNYKGRQEA